ncbi:MAG TPA: hypothetical protein VJ440_13305 [Candidatus Brocadiaceae bacterium]|nr:hypothetical protein [Candidatus Brocadiaceae bacterium]
MIHDAGCGMRDERMLDTNIRHLDVQEFQTGSATVSVARMKVADGII